MKTTSTDIFVYADWGELKTPQFMGILHAAVARGKEIFSFEYDDAWLKNQIHFLDPSLQLFSGRQYAPTQQNNFGLFLDSSPDRWGRLLMKRREALSARQEDRAEHILLESDYLLGVYDQHRLGALRFRTNQESAFLDNNERYASPPWTSLRELEQACFELEKDNIEKNASYTKWLNMLIAPGGSLGGARPKASVIDPHQHLWIAKFPSTHDEENMGAWEMVLHQLAQQAQIQVAPAQLKKFNSRHHTFLSSRFDRTTQGKRIHFASAMTMLQHLDGEEASYLELAEFISREGAQPAADLAQLWRRIVFFICVSNVDDHLRNHGFLLTQQGWLLAPAYDMNPVALGNGLTLNISQTDNSQDLTLALSVIDYFRLSSQQAHHIVDEIISAVKKWNTIASKIGISHGEQERMSRAFRLIDSC